jgi:23S rRNA pseudouridine2605 synthase
MNSLTEKIQKVLARAGLGSRREIETWIQNGRVQVNRRTATIGDRVSNTDKIHVDGRQLRLQTAPSRQVLCYHKPAGEICTRQDQKGRTTIFEHLPSPKHGRWISVGRLDFNTAGLLLLTNDGELAHRLMHPSYTIEREYAVRILGEVDKAMLKRLRDGVLLSDGMARFKHIVEAGGSGANHWYHVTLSEGRKHEVRRLWESQSVRVSRLIRIRFGPILLPKGLRTGRYVELDSQSEKALLQVVGLKAQLPARMSFKR